MGTAAAHGQKVVTACVVVGLLGGSERKLEIRQRCQKYPDLARLLQGPPAHRHLHQSLATTPEKRGKRWPSLALIPTRGSVPPKRPVPALHSIGWGARLTRSARRLVTPQ